MSAFLSFLWWVVEVPHPGTKPLGTFYIVWGNCLGTLPRLPGVSAGTARPGQPRSAYVDRDTELLKNASVLG